MMDLPTVFDTCHPDPEVLAGDLPDAIFAADLWEVMQEQAHPTEGLKLVLSDIGA